MGNTKFFTGKIMQKYRVSHSLSHPNLFLNVERDTRGASFGLKPNKIIFKNTTNIY